MHVDRLDKLRQQIIWLQREMDSSDDERCPEPERCIYCTLPAGFDGIICQQCSDSHGARLARCIEQHREIVLGMEQIQIGMESVFPAIAASIQKYVLALAC